MKFRVIELLKAKRKMFLMRRKSVMKGTKYILGLKSGISLKDGSLKEDIIIGNYVCFYGNLSSQNRGKIKIGDYCRIGLKTNILAVNSIEIGSYVTMADYIVITDNNNHPLSPDFRKFMREQMDKAGTNLWKHSDNAPVVIEDNVWIGTRVRVHKGVRVGKNSIIAACSVVTKDVPRNSIVAGNPAKVVKINIDQIPAPETCESFKKSFK